MDEFKFENFGVKYDDKVILSELSFTVARGEFICIVGPSGAGKSTVLKHINRLEPGATGSIFWRGKNIEDYEVHELRRQIAYIFQTAVMFPGSVKDNLLMAFDYGKPIPKEEQIARMKKACLEAEIPDETLTKEAQTLSGGQAQRVGIARMLMLDPPVLLLDEPTASLDVETSNNFIHSLKKIQQDSKGEITFFMITHRLEEAKFLADRVMFLADGKILEFSEKDQFFQYPQTDRAREFLKAQNLNN